MGFRKGHSTIGHIKFVLHVIIALFKISKEKLYCSFINYEKAFDSVWRIGLWNKILLNGNIDWKCFRIINNMYTGMKTQIKFNGDLLESFTCQHGSQTRWKLIPIYIFYLFLKTTWNNSWKQIILMVYHIFPNCSWTNCTFTKNYKFFYMLMTI